MSGSSRPSGSTQGFVMQLEFPWRDEAALERELEEHTRLRLRLTRTDNTSTLMSMKHGRPGEAALRLHHMFLAASPRVIKALGAWLTRPRARKSGDVLDAFIEQNQHLIRSRPRPARRLSTRGRYVDLKALFDALNRLYFGGSVTARITWGRMPPLRRRRSIRFGSFSVEDDLIRVNPLLDQEFVPEYFVRYIVFHEMLHADLGIGETASGRQRFHTREFKRREQTYPDYTRAVAWQNRPANLSRLLGTKRQA